MTSDLEPSSSTGYEDPNHDCSSEGAAFFIKFEHLVLTFSENRNFEDNLSTYSFLENLIIATFRKIDCELDEIATSTVEDS